MWTAKYQIAYDKDIIVNLHREELLLFEIHHTVDNQWFLAQLQRKEPSYYVFKER